MYNYINKFDQFLTEDISQSAIFVWFNFSNLQSILKNGIKFKPNDDKRFKFKYSISSTRNSKWRWGGGDCRITLDRKEILSNFKVLPYSHHGFVEWEERIFTNRHEYLHPKFFKKIEIDNKYHIEIKDDEFDFPIVMVDFIKNRIDAYGGRYLNPPAIRR